MNMVTALIKNSEGVLKDAPVTRGLCEAARMLEECYDTVKVNLSGRGGKKKVECLAL